jgi:uncharacterized protein
MIKIRWFAFSVVAFALLGLWCYYLGWGMILPLPLSAVGKGLLWVFMASPFLAIAWLPLFYMARGRKDRKVSHERMARISYLSLGLVSLLLPINAARDLAYNGLEAFDGLVGRQPSALFDSTALTSINPLLLYGTNASLVVLALASLLLLYGFYEAQRTPRVKKTFIPVHGLPVSWEPLTIVQISDLHVGHSVGKRFVENVVKEVNALKPDIIALTGDIVDGKPTNLRDSLTPLKDLSSKLGTFFVTGNHEYYWGADQWTEEMEKLGITPLTNSHGLIKHGANPVVVAGVSDYYSQRLSKTKSDPKAALAGAPESVFRLLLAHQPNSVHEASEVSYHLQLSGHTHGGQFIPWTWVIRFFHPVARGLKWYKKMWIYVSCGTGSWGPPLRIGARSEITFHKVMRAY